MQPRPARDQLPYGPALQTADEHSIYKNGAKEIAAQEGMAITFMAKYDEREGNLVPRPPLAARRGRHAAVRRPPEVFDRFIAGQLACLRELTLFYAPTQLLQALRGGSFARPRSPGASDNRTCSLRVVGHGPARGSSLRLPGGRRQPLPRARRADRRRPARVDQSSSSSRRARATRTSPTSRACRQRCGRPRDLFAASAVAREAFGEEVVAHYLNYAQVELAAFDSAVTDWERRRGFERL